MAEPMGYTVVVRFDTQACVAICTNWYEVNNNIAYFCRKYACHELKNVFVDAFYSMAGAGSNINEHI